MSHTEKKKSVQFFEWFFKRFNSFESYFRRKRFNSLSHIWKEKDSILWVILKNQFFQSYWKTSFRVNFWKKRWFNSLSHVKKKVQFWVKFRKREGSILWVFFFLKNTNYLSHILFWTILWVTFKNKVQFFGSHSKTKFNSLSHIFCTRPTDQMVMSHMNSATRITKQKAEESTNTESQHSRLICTQLPLRQKNWKKLPTIV